MKTTVILAGAAAALAITLTGCSTSVGVGKPASPGGFAIHSGDLNPSPEELAPWRRFEVDADGNRYLPARTALPERITTRDGEVRSGDDACYWAGGDLLMSDPPLCTVDIAVENGDFEPDYLPIPTNGER
ncbi:hypothetical protein ABQE48_16510 [Mycolicibacterium thermoresistibile]